jgi:hypothetical protein
MEDSMRELTNLELDAVGGGFTIVKGNGGVAINNVVHQRISQDASVEDAHDVTQIQAASQSNSITIGPPSSGGGGMPKPPGMGPM